MSDEGRTIQRERRVKTEEKKETTLCLLDILRPQNMIETSSLRFFLKSLAAIFVAMLTQGNVSERDESHAYNDSCPPA